MDAKSKIKWLKADSKRVMRALIEEALQSRFLHGSHNTLKLKKSLATVGRLDLVDRTLLSPSVHKIHAERLSNRFLAKWIKIRDKARTDLIKLHQRDRAEHSTPTDNDIAGNAFRFLTIVDSVAAVDAKSAVSAAVKLKKNVTLIAQSIKGISCLGVIEVEVISMTEMRKLRNLDTTTNSEWRKLDVCEALSKSLRVTSAESLFLIHFHGIVTAKSVEAFDHFNQQLKRKKRWSIAPRQIELKKLSTQFAGKPKSVEQNLRHIASYITKGGNDWMANKAYLRYKIGFENDDDQVNDEATWVAKNWRRSKLLKQEHSEDGITDALSLTVREIVQLAITIDQLMGLNRARTGYLVSSS